jgi:hypothetical protein
MIKDKRLDKGNYIEMISAAMIISTFLNGLLHTYGNNGRLGSYD